MNYNLFLDDIRNPADIKWVEYPLIHWVVVRNYQEFIDTIIKNGVPNVVSFDHDLADEHYAKFLNSRLRGEFSYDDMTEKTGYHACKWLIEHCLEKGISLPMCFIHTQNPIGRDNIQSLLDSYRKNCNT